MNIHRPVIGDILTLLDEIAPFSLSESWDNSGLQAGNRDQAVKKILIGLDVSAGLMEYAAEHSVDLVITHHPLWIQPEKRIDFGRMPGKAVEMAAKHDIGIVSLHTNLDKAQGGLNDCFAALIGLDTACSDPEGEALSEGSGPDRAVAAIWRMGNLNPPLSLYDLARDIKNRLGLDQVRIAGDSRMMVRSAAVCTGSGGSLVDAFVRSQADAFITGDIKYHDARRVEETARGLIDVGHFGSERLAVDLLYNRLGPVFRKKGLEIELIRYAAEKDPFTLI